ncbi:uncharacterized protein LOC105681888 [Bombus impatiens]|uniref:Uncharacterized protein LOC105681888 n=1 Tax=Bombus impatiens TaxID=132113 RepID=A0A6P3V5I4_BOMIM|nr:uncharacterized protein LOC105681888 [Bombus impatiens]
MYGAPVWADDLMASRCSILLLRRLHRVTAIRIIRGYRTVSHASATALAASSPWELRALALKKRYTHRRVWHPGEDPTEKAAPNDIGTAEEDTWDRWRSQLINEGGEHRGAEGVLPNWEAWRSRHGFPLTFRMTQILAGHGVFARVISAYCFIKAMHMLLSFFTRGSSTSKAASRGLFLRQSLLYLHIQGFSTLRHSDAL